MPDLLPLFLTLDGRDVVLVGGGRVATSKLQALLAARARVRVVAPEVSADIERAGVEAGVEIVRREFVAADLDGAWLAVAAATPDVNRQVAAAAEPRRIFVNAVDDPSNASAFLSGTLRRDGVTIAVSTGGAAPALTALLREALDAVLPEDLGRWMAEARRQRKSWRRDQVPMAARKPRLLDALNELYTKTAEHAKHAEAQNPIYSAGSAVSAINRVGHVSLVGAGPGDPALLTRKAIARLRAADLVLYDALIDDRILRYARKAQRFFAGKRGPQRGAPDAAAASGTPQRGSRAGDLMRAGRPSGNGAPRQAMKQETVHAVMIRAARRGRRVVRLKGGDPFVFGRGGEEALALRAAGIPFDVVPGVTSAVAAASLAGIPVTYRGVSSAVLVVSGHEEGAFASAIGALQPKGVTLVVLMGGGRSARISETLISRGWAPATPAAIVINASAADQHVWRGTLGRLADWQEDLRGSLSSRGSQGLRGSPGSQGPVTIIVGDVVALAAADDAANAGLERLYVTGT